MSSSSGSTCATAPVLPRYLHFGLDARGAAREAPRIKARAGSVPLSSVGYEHYDAHLRRLGPSLEVELAWTDGQIKVAPSPRRLRRSALSRAVSFTDPFTNALLDRRSYIR